MIPSGNTILILTTTSRMTGIKVKKKNIKINDSISNIEKDYLKLLNKLEEKVRIKLKKRKLL